MCNIRLFSFVPCYSFDFFSLKVYQARLRRSGQVVAVKVQRPGVQAAISLDILILRFLAGLIRRAGKFNTDLQVTKGENVAICNLN